MSETAVNPLTANHDVREDSVEVTGSFNNWTIRAGLGAASIALIAISLYSLQVTSDGLLVATTGVVTCCAALALGSLTGFLFGVPKVLQSSTAEAKPLAFVSNSNLEQISDWLTKVIVGAGLVQIAALPGALAAFGSNLSPAFGGTPTSPVFAVGLLLYGFTVGFLLMYMWTRKRFLEILQRFDGHLRYYRAETRDNV